MAPLIEELLDRAVRDITAERRFPEATYRLQFHAGFTFRDACRLVPYLHELGISDCYASPYLKARPGSTHGYDILDHRQLNPEIGTQEDYDAWIGAMKEHGMGQILDVVPNHMGIVGNENMWWNDVLENGQSSPYAAYFDINWFSYKPSLHERVLLPILGDPYGTVLEAQQLTLRYQAGAFMVHYFDNRFPIALCTYGKILGFRASELEKRLNPTAPEFIEYHSILTALGHLPPRNVTDPVRVAERQREKEVVKRRLAALSESCPPVRQFIEENIRLFNGTLGDPHSFDLLDDLLNEQPYRLASWRVAADEINYRRFFDVNELAALSMERLEVFLATHELIFRLLREKKVTGLRVDHPDGLYDPRQYLTRLQQYYVLERVRGILQTSPEYRASDWKSLQQPLLGAIADAAARGPDSSLWRLLYVVVEKILGRAEPLPEDWPIYGTTGYEFLNTLNGVFVDAEHADAFTRIYQSWTRMTDPFLDLLYQKKFLILQVSLSGELHMLGHQLDRLAQAHRWSRDFTLNSLRHALRGIIACFPVYRSYISEGGIPRRDLPLIHLAVARAKRRNPAINASIFDFVRDLLLLKYVEAAAPEERAEQLRFVGKFQQVTAPVMAKGLEDTLFYVYDRLLSVNEVGGDPDQFGLSVTEFHRRNEQRRQLWPYALSTTSTHDTKRSEDIRARLNVLSELPRDWQKCLARWSVLNERHRAPSADDEPAVPDRNEEYFSYQTLLGAWPLEPYTSQDYRDFIARIQAYLQKAFHEAKEHTSWVNPNPVHDAAMEHFVAAVLDPDRNSRFLRHFRILQRRISHCGLFNSLAQVLLKITSPGAADIYQGNELWDLSLVDPDNRRSVDYPLRQRLLRELRLELARKEFDRPVWARHLVERKEDGRIKLFVTWQALRCRRAHPGLFAEGAYVAVEAQGEQSLNVCSFVRTPLAFPSPPGTGGKERVAHPTLFPDVGGEGKVKGALVAVPRLITRLVSRLDETPLGPEVWTDSILLLPEPFGSRPLRNLFTGEVVEPVEKNGRKTLPLAAVFANFPVALLLAQ
jgi:(1->4)-alpha-D-glucan 1-alpha-D-glucosylmutase